tara:strand:+ start:507 stop:1499 length:993 start_codon:yes stop_codon:yes gene_type:complete
MSIDPLKLDNPIDMEAVPREKLPIQFPAMHVFDWEHVRQSVIVLGGVVLTSVACAYYVSQAVSEHVTLVSGVSRMLVLAMTVALFIRWIDRSQFAFYATATVSAICLFATATLVFIPGGTGALNATCTLTMLSLILTAAEVAIHFQAIDAEILRRDPAIAEKRRQQNSGVLQFFAVVMGTSMCFAMWSSLRIVFVPVAALLGMVIAFNLLVGIAKYPGKFLPLTIKHYLGYPASTVLAPGLIYSSAPHPLLRLLPLILVCVESALIAVADHGIANITMEPLLMAGCGLTAGITALMLGASLSARPIHFNVDRTPFDVVVSKLRPVENKNG